MPNGEVPVRITKSGAPIETVDQWHAAAPPKRADQWQAGRSAMECAQAWCGGAAGPRVPGEILSLLASHPHTAAARVEWATPEYRARFDRLRGEPRNADVVALAQHPAGPVALSIEAKADEPFDRTVRDVLRSAAERIAADGRTFAVQRVQQLAATLLRPPVQGATPLGDLRYQLLTAAAGALAFAAEVRARRAVLIVHEFITDRTEDAKQEENARDLDRFGARLLAVPAIAVLPGVLLGPIEVPGRPLFPAPADLYIGKARRTTRAGSGAG